MADCDAVRHRQHSIPSRRRHRLNAVDRGGPGTREIRRSAQPTEIPVATGAKSPQLRALSGRRRSRSREFTCTSNQCPAPGNRRTMKPPEETLPSLALFHRTASKIAEGRRLPARRKFIASKASRSRQQRRTGATRRCAKLPRWQAAMDAKASGPAGEPLRLQTNLPATGFRIDQVPRRFRSELSRKRSLLGPDGWKNRPDPSRPCGGGASACPSPLHMLQSLAGDASSSFSRSTRPAMVRPAPGRISGLGSPCPISASRRITRLGVRKV